MSDLPRYWTDLPNRKKIMLRVVALYVLDERYEDLPEYAQEYLRDPDWCPCCLSCHPNMKFYKSNAIFRSDVQKLQEWNDLSRKGSYYA